jgi:hypothetical protein
VHDQAIGQCAFVMRFCALKNTKVICEREMKIKSLYIYIGGAGVQNVQFKC